MPKTPTIQQRLRSPQSWLIDDKSRRELMLEAADAIDRLREWKPIESVPIDEPVLLYFRKLSLRTCGTIYSETAWHTEGLGRNANGDYPPTHWLPLNADPDAC